MNYAAVIIFHKNALNYYNNRWLEKCLDSIENQTYQKFDIFEIAYGDNKDNEVSLLKYFNKMTNKKKYFYKKKFKDHSYAMNFLINKVFDMQYKYCFNINIDDYYHNSRFQRQIDVINKLDYDLVSAQMYYVNEEDKIINKLDHLAFTFNKKESLKKQIKKEQEYIKKELNNNHNLIAHPCVCFTKKFWEKVGPYENKVPIEDLELCKKGISLNMKMHVSKKFLLYYRIHELQTVKKS